MFSDTHRSDEEGDEDDGKTMLHLVPKALVPSWCPTEGLPMIGGVCQHHYEQGPPLLEDTKYRIYDHLTDPPADETET